MSVRDRAIERLLHEHYRKQGKRLYFTYGTPSQPDYDAQKLQWANFYDSLILSIDWNRILVDAAGRAIALEEGRDPDHLVPNIDEIPIYGEDIKAALLNDRPGAPDWEKDKNRHLELRKSPL